MAGIKAVPTHSMLAGAVFLLVAVLEGSTVLGSKADGAAHATNICTTSAASDGISVTVDTETKTVTFVCDTGINNVLPSPSETRLAKYYAGPNLEDEEELETLFGQGSQATITPSQRNSTGKSTVELTLGKLPETMKTIYFGCKTPASLPGVAGVGVGVGVPGARRLAAAKTAAEKCVVTVTVPADPAANISIQKHSFASFSLSGGRVCHCAPGCYSPMPAACTVAKQNMDLEITNESKSVSFQCDTNVGNLTPEKASDLIFDESCQNPVELADMLPSAKLATSTSGYTFSVEELPETAATFCYKCAAASDPEEEKKVSQPEPNACYVKIQVSQRSSAASTSAFAGSAQALLVGLGVSSAFFQVMY
uniref:SRS domain-containing protein n=1 Tax=Neospora caninum (strain Liverpool) TaxID=572307 RepID=F0JAX1_NEOCL|nr:SRS domain-containing protein [Neospora caninum Liverpool]CEL71237.1 TPA: SRS domain-containing protein [Neospora caninum Liverpool]